MIRIDRLLRLFVEQQKDDLVIDPLQVAQPGEIQTVEFPDDVQVEELVRKSPHETDVELAGLVCDRVGVPGIRAVNRRVDDRHVGPVDGNVPDDLERHAAQNALICLDGTVEQGQAAFYRAQSVGVGRDYLAEELRPEGAGQQVSLLERYGRKQRRVVLDPD